MLRSCWGVPARGGSLRALTGLCSAAARRAAWLRVVVVALAFGSLLIVAPILPAAGAVECKIWWGTVPGQDPLDRFPTYFSGTRVAVVAEVRTTTPGAFIYWVRVRVGGEQTKYVQLYPYVFLPYVYVQSRFASTHFADGAVVQVTAEAMDTMGQYGTAAPRSSTVYNKATLYGRNEWEQNPSWDSAGVPAARTNLTAMNHSICAENTTLGWTRMDLLADLVPCTAFFVNTHAVTPQIITADDEAETITATDMWLVRQVAVGSGYPPFNSGSPPVNLAFTNACITGLDNCFAEALLFPEYTAYNQNWSENQSEVSWRIQKLVVGTRSASEAFWGALSAGATAHQARDEASDAYWDAIGERRKDPRETLSVWGDYYTRLYGLYTYGDSIASGFWHD